MNCDYCEAEAAVNYQKVWVKFKIDKNGMYRQVREFDAMDIEEPIGVDNIHLCKKHGESWLEGKI